MIHHALFYNRSMRKFTHRAYALIAAILVAFSLAGCLGAGGAPSSTAVSASSASAAAVQSAQSATVATSTTKSTVTAIGDDSYAENHLTGDTYVAPDITVTRDGEYTDKDHVALYIHLYGRVPGNYISKSKARAAGWNNKEGNLWDVLPGKSIGGGGFYNDDNMMPDAPGREWFECDIDYDGGFRNAKRIVYSDDGLIYYTDDHYRTFERLY